jgi:predicted phage tail protein
VVEAIPEPVDLFISYARADEKFRAQLDRHLTVLRRRGVIKDWHDRRIGIGEDWGSSIDSALESAQIILALVSADYLASDYAYDVEMRRALDRHEAGEAHLIPVILRPANWADTPLGRLQALPRNGRPISQWRNRDEAFADVARGIEDVARSLRGESRLPSFSTTARRALTFAAAMLREDDAADPAKLRTAALLGALRASALEGMTPTTGDIVKLVLSRQTGGDAERTLAAAAAAAGLQLRGPEPEVLSIDTLSRTSAAALVDDAVDAQRRTGAQSVHLRHVLATGVDAAVPGEVLDELGVGMGELHDEWRASIARTWPQESANGWDTLLRDRLTPSGFELAGGFSTDAVDPTTAIPIERDHLGVRTYVTMLATVIADSRTHMPLSIGLFGEWGSGKSYFMGLLRGQVKALSKSGAAGYYENIAQLGFNAWHYADTNLWASLGQEIFEQLMGPANPVEKQRKALEREFMKRSHVRRELKAAARRAEETTARLRSELDKAASEQIRTARQLLKAVARTPTVQRQLDAAWSRLGIKDEADQARRLVAELQGTSTEYDELRQPLRAFGGRAAALVVAVVLVVGISALALDRWLAGGAFTALGTALAIALAITSRVHSGLHELRSAVSQIQAKPSAQLKALRRAEASQQALQAQLDDVTGRLGQLGRELAELSPGNRLYSFVSERAEGEGYRRHLGLISTIRKDFQQLVALMEDWRRRADTDEPGPLPIDRIVLYIDDLDRCSPSQVVDVLQAVHLLLALELFVVVVGVDPRWLLRSLQSKYGELLTATEDDQASGWQASPQDYLEKIFNIPFALTRMNSVNFKRLLGGLAVEGESDDERPRDESAPTGRNETDDQRPQIDDEGSSDEITVEPDSPVDMISRGKPAPPELRPLTDKELEMLSALAPLVATPREAKRLVNLYRMIRSTRDLSTASSFLGDEQHPGEYQAVVILLGILSGYGQLLNDVLNAPAAQAEPRVLGGLLHRDASTTWKEFAEGSKPQETKGEWRNEIVGKLEMETVRIWRAQHDGLGDATALVTLENLEAFQRWAPRIVRFSFLHSLSATESVTTHQG